MVGLAIRRILMRDHIFAESMDGVSDERGCIPETANEFGWRSKGEIQNIVEDDHLAIAVRSRSNADGRSRDFGRDHGGHFARNAFEHKERYARSIERHGIAHKLFDLGQRLALNLVAAHDVY